MSSWQAKRRFSGPTLRVTIGEPEGLDIVNTSSVANWGGGVGYLRSCGLLGFCLRSGRLDSRASRIGFLVREQVLPGRYLEVFSGGRGRFVEIILFSFCCLIITSVEWCTCKEKRRDERKEQSGKIRGKKVYQ